MGRLTFRSFEALQRRATLRLEADRKLADHRAGVIASSVLAAAGVKPPPLHRLFPSLAPPAPKERSLLESLKARATIHKKSDDDLR